MRGRKRCGASWGETTRDPGSAASARRLDPVESLLPSPNREHQL
jgi:hypothetical protein